MSVLVLGPLLRYVDATSATVWVETSAVATVRVVAGECHASARTFAVHGHHYALVELERLAPGSRTPYRVEVDGREVWPPADSECPPSQVATLEPGKPLRLAFGSCRVSVPHDRESNAAYGIDALHAYALHMAGLSCGGPAEDDKWPDLVLFLGDQVYADETSAEMREFIEARRSADEPPGLEIKDFEEYAHLYRLAWSYPVNRWLLSTLPSAMIFDDHDIRDDWNTSWSWKQEMDAQPWWRNRIVGGLASYWVYQHLGNLGPVERRADPLWQRISSYDGDGELDLTEALDELAEAADQRPESYRWSFSRDFDEQARLVVIDSRAARRLDPERRSILDDDEMRWFDDRLQGGFEHLLVGTSLPFLLSPALHHVEAFNEALAEGAWGKLGMRFGEWSRQAADMEHWAAFQAGFRRVAEMTLEVATGRRGRAPHTITFLSGDVHHSYLAEARPSRAQDGPEPVSRIRQAVCSPIRNPLPTSMRRVTTLAARRPVALLARLLARTARVQRSPLRWGLVQGPWFDNNLAVLEVRGRGLRIWWSAGAVAGDRPDRPSVRRVASVDAPE